MEVGTIQAHSSVVGADGEHVGIVDHVESDRIILTPNGPMANGKRHFIPVSWVDRVDAEIVHLSVSSQQVVQKWTTEDRDAGDDPFAANRERSVGGEVY